ncbi:MAG TPA: putative Ig domain-containing protein [Gemmatimonadaceae bacterium]
MYRFVAAVAFVPVVLFSTALGAQAPAPVGVVIPAPMQAAPTLAVMPPRQVQIGDSVRVPLVVNDLPPASVVDFRAERLPAGARIENGALRWRPLRADANATYDVGIQVYVSGVEVSRGDVRITVADAHRAPIIRQPTDRVIPPGDSLTQIIEASDPDGDPLSFAVTNVTDPSLPPRLDPRTNTLTWQAPRGSASRVYLWRVTASDGDGGNTTVEFNVSVKSQNVAPVCAPVRTYKRDEGDTLAIVLDADDANGDPLAYHPLATLPNGTLSGSTYRWTIPYGFVSPARQDSTVRFEWTATDPSSASTASSCFALVTVLRSIPDGPFRARQAQHRQLITDVRARIARYLASENATRDSLVSATTLKRTVKRASLVSALVGGLLQIATSEETRRISAAISATLTVGLGGWETTIDDGGPLSTRADAIAQDRTAMQRQLTRFLRKYGETVSRDALLGPTYDTDYGDLFDMVASSARIGA